MPRATGPNQSDPWAGIGQGTTLLAQHLSAIGVWAAAGYGLDRLFGTGPVLFAIGAVLGNATGVYMLYRRSLETAEREKKQDR